MFFRPVFLLCAAGGLLAGCGTTRQSIPPEPLPAPVLGTVLHVDSAQDLAVVSLQSNARLAGPFLYSRNPALRETARLEAGSQRRGRMLGVRILSGLPNPGDEVLAAPKEETEEEPGA